MRIPRLMSLALMAGLALAPASGCYRISYLNGTAAPANVVPYQQWYHIGIFGLVEFSQPVNVAQICPNGFARVDHEISFANGLVTWALNAVPAVLLTAAGSTTTAGLGWVYQPHTVRVHCIGGTAWNVDLDRDGLVTAARPVELGPRCVDPREELGEEAAAAVVPPPATP